VFIPKQESLAPPFWRDRFGAGQFGAGRFGASTDKQRHKYKYEMSGEAKFCLRPSVPVKECGLKVLY